MAFAALEDCIKLSIPQNKTENRTTKVMMNLTILVTPIKNKINLMHVDGIIMQDTVQGANPGLHPTPQETIKYTPGA